MKSKQTAAFLALFLGGFGVHRFYLGQRGLGLAYIFTTIFGMSRGLPLGFLLGLIDAISFFSMSDEKFDQKYNRGQERVQMRQRRGANRRRVQNSRQPNRSRVSAQQTRKRQAPRRNPFKLSGKKKLTEFDLTGAIDDFQRSVDINPDDYETHYLMARAYSLSEQATKAFDHLSIAVAQGFKDYEKIKTDDSLAFIRIHEDFEEFEKAGYRKTVVTHADQKSEKSEETLLAQLQRLADMRKKGLITDEDFELEKKRIMR